MRVLERVVSEIEAILLSRGTQRQTATLGATNIYHVAKATAPVAYLDANLQRRRGDVVCEGIASAQQQVNGGKEWHHSRHAIDDEKQDILYG